MHQCTPYNEESYFIPLFLLLAFTQLQYDIYILHVFVCACILHSNSYANSNICDYVKFLFSGFLCFVYFIHVVCYASDIFCMHSHSLIRIVRLLHTRANLNKIKLFIPFSFHRRHHRLRTYARLQYFKQILFFLLNKNCTFRIDKLKHLFLYFVVVESVLSVVAVSFLDLWFSFNHFNKVSERKGYGKQHAMSKCNVSFNFFF